MAEQSTRGTKTLHASIRLKTALTVTACFAVMLAVMVLALQTYLHARRQSRQAELAGLAAQTLEPYGSFKNAFFKEALSHVQAYAGNLANVPGGVPDIPGANLAAIFDGKGEVLAAFGTVTDGLREFEERLRTQSYAARQGYAVLDGAAWQLFCFPFGDQGNIIVGQRLFHESKPVRSDLADGTPAWGAILPVSGTALSLGERTALWEDSTLFLPAGGSHGGAYYRTVYDLFGEPTLAVAVEADSGIPQRDIALLAVLLLSGLACWLAVTLLAVRFVRRGVSEPLTAFAEQLRPLDLHTADNPPALEASSAEMEQLASSLSGVLGRVREESLKVRRQSEELDERNRVLFASLSVDPSTGLLNRAGALGTLEDLIAKKAEGLTLYLLQFGGASALDIELGKEAVSELLKEAAARLRGAMGDALIARADKEALLLGVAGLDDDDARQMVAEHALSLCLVPFELRGREVAAKVSVGSAAFPRDGSEAERLLDNAAFAAGEAQIQSRRSSHLPYRPALRTALETRLGLERRLRGTILEGGRELRAYFQPQVNLKTGQTDRCEALLRWVSPQGLLLPADFMPQARAAGLAPALDCWMAEECCRAALRFAGANSPAKLSLNVDVRTLLEGGFAEAVQSAAAEVGVLFDVLEVELAETALPSDPAALEQLCATTAALQELGVCVTVDQYGAGMSSPGLLRRLNVTRLKLASSLVASLGDPDAVDELRAVLAVAKRLDLPLTAAGVETPAQLEALRQLGCEEAVGYLLCAPKPAGDCLAFMQGEEEGV